MPFRSFALLLLALLVGSCSSLRSKLCGSENEACCDAQACNAGLVCNPNNTCAPCGRPGLACCTNTACNQGALCGADGLCAACGAEKEVCCAQNACNRSLACDRGTCQLPLSCTTNCIVGSKRCSATGGVEQCAAPIACPEWTTLVPSCPQGTTCMANGADALCLDRCPGACAPQVRVCTPNGLKECVVPSATECPQLQAGADDPDNPACIAGAGGTDFVWESPRPLGTAIVDAVGFDFNQMLLLDALGNVLRNNNLSWAYELRANAVLGLNGVAMCSPGEFLAVGRNGMVQRRRAGFWAQEGFPTTAVNLTAVACQLNNQAVAVSSSGRMFLRNGNRVWRELPLVTNAALTAVTVNTFDDDAYAVGDNGVVVHCTNLNGAGGAPSCAAQASGTTSPLTSIFKSQVSGLVLASGPDVLLRRSVAGWALEDTGLGVDFKGGQLRGSSDGVSSTNDVVYLLTTSRPLGLAVLVAGDWSVRAPPAGSPTERFMTALALDERRAVFFTDDLSAAPRILFNAQRALDDGSSGQKVWSVRGGAVATPESLRAVSGAQGLVVAVGERGARVVRENEAWRDDRGGLDITQALNGVTTISRDEAYAVGGLGLILGRRFGAWKVERPVTGAQTLYAIASDGAQVVAVGTDGEWVSKPVGAQASAWSRVAHGKTTLDLNAVAAYQGTFTAVGRDCTVLSLTGSTFTLEAVPTSACSGEELFSVWRGPNGEAWAGGTGGVVIHKRSGVWEREYIEEPGFEPVEAIAVHSGVPYLVVPLGSGLQARSGGAWQRVDRLLFSSPSAMWSGPDGLYLVGFGGQILRRP